MTVLNIIPIRSRTTYFDMENSIFSVIVIPRTKMFYNYYLNGTEEKRSMQKERLIEFLSDLCPEKASTIRRNIYDGVPFYLEIETNFITEIEEDIKENFTRKEKIFGESPIKSKMGIKKSNKEIEEKRFSILTRIKKLFSS